jgi:uncharacterized protein
MRIEIVYARPEAQIVEVVTLPRGATVRDALVASGILERFPEIDVAKTAFGVYGMRVSLDAVLSEDDRVEIYRPLKVDPKEARRRRAQVRHSAKR